MTLATDGARERPMARLVISDRRALGEGVVLTVVGQDPVTRMLYEFGSTTGSSHGPIVPTQQTAPVRRARGMLRLQLGVGYALDRQAMKTGD
jgi:hypothetical protein